MMNVEVRNVIERRHRIRFGHTLDGAYLSDGSWVWIEPQNDRNYD